LAGKVREQGAHLCAAVQVSDPASFAVESEQYLCDGEGEQFGVG